MGIILVIMFVLFVALGVDLPIGWEIASAKQAIIGVSCSLVLYIVISLLTKPNYQKADRFIEKTNIL